MFSGVENTIRIDAGTNPYAQSRFCLGRIANNKRNKLIEQVRTSIGRGIELSGGHQHSRGIFTLTYLPSSFLTIISNKIMNCSICENDRSLTQKNYLGPKIKFHPKFS